MSEQEIAGLIIGVILFCLLLGDVILRIGDWLRGKDG